MKLKANLALIGLVAALAVVGYGVYKTELPSGPRVRSTTRRNPADRPIVVDQTSLLTAEQLVRLPTAPDERSFAQDALRLADQEMDLAFAQAVRSILNQPKVSTPEVKALEERLQSAQRSLAADQQRVKELAAALESATPATKQSLSDRLDLAKAQVVLDQDEIDDSSQDLQRAGGDPQGRMQGMMEEHDAASKSSDSVRVNVTRITETHGLVEHLQALQSLYLKESQLEDARATADSLGAAFKQRHDRIEARAAALRDSANAAAGADSTAALLVTAQRRAQSEKTRATLDQRVDIQRRLSDVYANWLTVNAAHQRVAINRSLKSIALILIILLVATIIARLIEPKHDAAGVVDRRRTQTMHMIARVSLQVTAVLLILLVVFGPPNNLGTFLGLAGAGLTVALKDFIIGFLGWFVLMGKNGIRIGDLVEINGVTGEVVELGLFYTVLLETGDWSDAGRPTGRRVTFTNGFAIEGHYFNFSTSGRWLWDDVRIVVPESRDPYPIVEAIQKEVEERTADSAREAESQWRAARRSPHSDPLPVAPSITLKPVSGGVEIIARYITRVAQREELRAQLYRTAVTMLGAKAPA
jgi:small-conductance mechanosensitive channel